MELLHNAFFTLGATTWDNRRRIMELAEEKSLLFDEAAVRDATAVLTNPRRRLVAEVGWLPGLAPRRVSEALSILQSEPAKLPSLGALPGLARANLLADGLLGAIDELSPRIVALWIVELAAAYDEVKLDEMVASLNEDRSVAGFPAISDPQLVHAELQARRREYVKAIRKALDTMPSHVLVEVVTIAVDEATDCGQRQARILIDDLVDRYNVEAKAFFEAETENITALIEDVREAVSRVEDADNVSTSDVIERLVGKLELVVRNWDRVAQPIQVSVRSRGLPHELSRTVAEKIRSLAIELFNEHDLLEISRRLTALQQEVFAEVDQVVEKLAEDASTLDGIAEQRTQFLAREQERADSWRREITYEADVGALFTSKLRISPDGVQWKESTIPLDEIKRLRWGGTRHSVNGIPTGTTYNVFVGGELGGTTIELRTKQIYTEFVDRLWKAAGARLLVDMLGGLRGGQRYYFGTVVVTDHGVELERRRLFAANERVSCKWTDLVIGNRPGAFYIAKKGDPKLAVELSYQEMDNVHVLEAAMRMFWKRVSPKLSDLLDGAD